MTDENGKSHPKNIVQKYINAYKDTLNKIGAQGIIVRAATMSELYGNEVNNALKK